MESKQKDTVHMVELVEKKLEEFSERLSNIEQKVAEVERKAKRSFGNYQKYVRLLNDVMVGDLLVMSRISFLAHAPFRKMRAFDDTIDELLAKEKHKKKLAKLGFEFSYVVSNRQIALMISIAEHWGTPFEELASYLIMKLGKKDASKLVDKTDIIENYGKEVLPIWESLLKD